MYTQNGSTNRLVEAVLIEVIWPEFIGGLEAGEYSNKLFVPHPLRGFHSRVRHQLGCTLPPRRWPSARPPTFTWGGAIFADREAARFRRVLKAAAATTSLELPRGCSSAHRGPGTDSANLCHVGPDPRPHPHARGTFPSIRS